MNRSLALTIALALTATACSAHAGALVDLGVTDLDTGDRLKVYRSGGQYYVAGTPGHRYALTLDNRTGQRVMAVLSVDGVNAVTGATAGALQSGYVLDPYEHAQVKGWRKNLSEVAEFVFTSVPRSYAARTGRPQNVGVIGVAVFREAYRAPPALSPPAWEPRDERDDYARGNEPGAKAQAESSDSLAGRAGSAPAPVTAPSGARESGQDFGSGMAKSRAAPRARQELGTGHGDRRYDPVNTTAFERASDRPDEVISLYYDDWNGLVARGVVAPRRPYRAPDPFPLTFAPDPPRW